MEMRRKLYTAQHRVVDGRGGGPVSESCSKEGRSGLVRLWPEYLNMEFAATKPTLAMPDVKQMIEQRETPRYRSMDPRTLFAPGGVASRGAEARAGAGAAPGGAGAAPPGSETGTGALGPAQHIWCAYAR
jgi:hypothetical protein